MERTNKDCDDLLRSAQSYVQEARSGSDYGTDFVTRGLPFTEKLKG
jgi:hypothetical protein